MNRAAVVTAARTDKSHVATNEAASSGAASASSQWASAGFMNESVKLIAESVGIANLSEEGCREMASNLTFTINSLFLVSHVSSSLNTNEIFYWGIRRTNI